MLAERQNTVFEKPAKVSISPKVNQIDRAAFWRFCTYTSARTRFIDSEARGELTAYDLDKLLVDQQWRCAVSDIAFEPPAIGEAKRNPFGPSIDRITAGGKYEIGNVRLVCNIVNFAMNEWGEHALHRLVFEMQKHTAPT